MIRNLKVLSLALAATIAMGIVTSPAAQAAPEFTAFTTPSKTYVTSVLDGEQIGQNELVAGAGTVKCTTANYTGLLSGGKGTEVTLEPNYAGCKYVGFFTTDVKMNGCAYVLRPTEKGIPDEYIAHVDITCPGISVINFIVTGAMSNPICTIQIDPQTKLKTVAIRNDTVESPTDIEIEWRVENIKYKAINEGGVGCGVKNGTYTNGEYFGHTTLRATNEAGSYIDLEMSGE